MDAISAGAVVEHKIFGRGKVERVYEDTVIVNFDHPTVHKKIRSVPAHFLEVLTSGRSKEHHPAPEATVLRRSVGTDVL